MLTYADVFYGGLRKISLVAMPLIATTSADDAELLAADELGGMAPPGIPQHEKATHTSAAARTEEQCCGDFCESMLSWLRVSRLLAYADVCALWVLTYADVC